MERIRLLLASMALLLVSAGVAGAQPVIITDSPLPAGQVGSSYSQILMANGGTGTYTNWAITAGALPAGLGIAPNGNNGRISGTPTQSGSFNFTVQVTDDLLATGTKVFDLTINPAVNITTTSLPGGTVGIAYSQSLAATGGATPYTWDVSAGSLGPLTLSPSGTITGTPTTATTLNFTARVTDDLGGIDTQPLSITVGAGVNITTASLPGGTVGVPYNQSLAATGGQTPYTWDVSAGSLGPLTLSPSGTITGTPTTSTTLSFVARVTDDLGGVDTQALQITIGAGVNITTTSLPGGTVGVAYNQSLAATGGQVPYTWEVSGGSLAPLVLNSNGTITGTPTTATTLNFTARVTDNLGGTDTQALSIAVGAAVSITTTTLPGGTVGLAYNQSLAATGGQAPYTWNVSAGSLAPLVLNSNGTITGTPTTATTLNFTARVTDNLGGTDTQALSIAVGAAVNITTTSLPDGTVGAAYNQSLAATGGQGPYNWDVSAGSLAPLVLNSNGTITGTPTTATTLNFTARVTDNLGGIDTQALSITVGAAINITTTSLPNGTRGVPYSQTLNATGGLLGTYIWSVVSGSGNLPTGLNLGSLSGTISGTPSASGTFDFTVRVTDLLLRTDTQALTIDINNPVPSVLSLSPASAVAGGPAFTLTVNGPGNSSSFVPSSVVRWNGENLTTAFVSATQLTASVSAERIALAGSASVSVNTPGPGGGTSNAVSFTITNPTDLSITNVIPGTAIAGSGTLQITVRGSNFVPNSAVRWLGQAVPATFLSPTEITATIDASLLATAGTAGITVVNPPPGGGTSNVFTFIINNPLPVLSSISPDGKSAGQAAFTLTLTGNNFISASQVHWNGMTLPSTFISPTELRATVAASLIANPGTASVTVENPEPGGGISAARTFTIGDQLTITTETPLPSGTIGVPYSRTINAVGGDPPYRWGLAVGSQVPAGLALNPNSGILSGTPTEIGTYSVNIQVTDSLNVMASKAFVLTVSPATFLITTASPLPNAQLGAAYTQTFAASGGTVPYVNWSVTGGQLPGGLTLNTANGTLSGTPNAAGAFNFTITVTDNASETASKQFTLTVPPPGNVLTILTTSCPAASVGAAYNCSFTASGGTPAYTWAITAGTLPAGLALNITSGVISGTPQSVGQANLTMRVTDAVTATDTQTFTINVTSATVTISLLGTAGPAQQNQVTLTLPQALSTAVTGQVALSFTPDPALPNGGVGLDDPAIQFSGNRQRTASFTVPAGSREATFNGGNLMLQTGTIAGTVTVTLTSMQSGGSVIVPSPAPSQTIVIARLAPVISSVRIVNRTAAGFSVEVTGYATPRELTQAGFQFTGQNLQGAQATVQLGTVAQTWYASQASVPFGSLFTYTQPFTTSADPAGITSVSVTLTNSLGNSAPVSANF